MFRCCLGLLAATKGHRAICTSVRHYRRRYQAKRLDWAGRLAAIYALDERKDHTLRFGTAKSFRTPLIALRKAMGGKLPVGGGLYALNVDLPADDLRNEETWSLETGYKGKLADGVFL
jgi:outer membrane receptor protein involved in Fe transport